MLENDQQNAPSRASVITYLISCAIIAKNSDFLSLASRSFLARIASDISRELKRMTGSPVTTHKDCGEQKTSNGGPRKHYP